MLANRWPHSASGHTLKYVYLVMIPEMFVSATLKGNEGHTVETDSSFFLFLILTDSVQCAMKKELAKNKKMCFI